MKKYIFAILLAVVVWSCAPSVYNLYEKHKADPNLEHTQISGEVLNVGSFLIPKKEKAALRLLKSIKSVDIVSYDEQKSAEFHKEFLNSLKNGGYKKIVKKDATFYVKRRLGTVKEFHTFNKKNGELTIFSVNGSFSVFDLDKAYRLIKKQQRMKGFLKDLRVE